MAINRNITGIKVDDSADDGKVPVFNSTTKVFDMESPGGVSPKVVGKLTIPSTHNQAFYELTVSGVVSTDIVVASANAGFSIMNQEFLGATPTSNKITFFTYQSPAEVGEDFTISYIVYAA